MNRTLVYVVLAIVVGVFAYRKGMPDPEINASQFSETGQQYYPDFSDPNIANGIRVVVFDEKASDIKSFEVQQKKGLWKIPSHYDYPVDGKDQLSKTAASLIGVKRGAVAGESEVDFKRLGVIDPLTDDDSLKEFSGERLTLTKGETVLVDLIVGKQVPERNGFYYVRKPDEKLTYIAELEIQLTTNFSDWIEPDLLKLDQSKLRGIKVRDYSVDEQRGAIIMSEFFDLNRPDQSTAWKLTSFNPKTKEPGETTEKLKTAELNGIINSLGDLKIAGVRRKPSFISSDLKLSGEVTPSRESQLFLSQIGYVFAPNSEKKTFELFSNQGDLTAVTDSGVAYVLRFGAVFTGNEFDIEVGSVTPKEETKNDKKPEDGKPIITPGSGADNLQASRYLFVSVQFDPSALGDAPVEPTPPPKKKPEEKTEAEKKPKTKPEEKPEEKKPVEEVDLQKAYESAVEQYKTDLIAYQEKIVDGKKKVAELNERFADWYYVIDAASFDSLNKSKDDLVEVEKPAPTQPPEATPPTTNPQKPSEPKTEKPVSPQTTPQQPKPAPTGKPEPIPETTKKPAEKPAPVKESKPVAPPKKPAESPAP